MIRVFLWNKQLVITKKNEKEFRDEFGRGGEVVEIINDEKNIEDVTAKLERIYKVPVVVDGKFKKKLKIGWRYMTEEQRERTVIAVKQYRTGRPWEQEVRDKISESRAGVGNFEGKKHTQESRIMTSMSMKGNTNATGLKWAHDPLTGEEKRIRDGMLPNGFIWGRTAEIVDWFRGNRIV